MEDIYVALARKSLTSFIKTGRRISVPFPSGYGEPDRLGPAGCRGAFRLRERRSAGGLRERHQ